MIEIKTVPFVPRGWSDAVLTASQAKKLLAQPYHVLLSTGRGHLFARLVPQAPADILTITVAPDHRRQGHARALITHIMELARAAHCPAITLEVRASNYPARNMYEHQGFTVANTRAAYYQNPTEDAIVLTLNLA